jgi:hypothetical protein
MHGPSVPATVSFDAEWSGVTSQAQIGGAGKEFTAQVKVTSATVSFTAKETGFTFVSDAASTSKTLFAEIGTVLVGTAPISLSATPYHRRHHHGGGGPTP